MSRKDLWAATLGEGSLILAVALVGFTTYHPFVLASLGPTAYEQVETPERPSARPYNVILGHILAARRGMRQLQSCKPGIRHRFPRTACRFPAYGPRCLPAFSP